MGVACQPECRRYGDGRVGGARIDEYLRVENVRLFVAGVLAGGGLGLVWAERRSRRWGPAVVVAGYVVAALMSWRDDRPEAGGRHLLVGGALVGLAALGAYRLLKRDGLPWPAMVAGAVVSLGGVFLAVPETGPAVLGVGVVVGLAAAAWRTGSALVPAACAALAVVVGWAAVTGGAGKGSAVVGGTLCLGIAPWVGLRSLLPASWPGFRPGWWLLMPHAALAFAAARWIGVARPAGWDRVAVLAACGLAVAAVIRVRSS